MRRGGRLYWRMVRMRERTLAARPRGSNDYRGDIDDHYDRNDIMRKIDSLPLGWRMLINEHGFTPVMEARSRGLNIVNAERAMNDRREWRQRELAEGRA